MFKQEKPSLVILMIVQIFGENGSTGRGGERVVGGGGGGGVEDFA